MFRTKVSRILSPIVESVLVATIVVVVFNALFHGYFHIDDAVNENLPYSLEMSKRLFNGEFPILTTNSFSGGNMLVDFDRNPLNPVMYLAFLAWHLFGNATVVAGIFSGISIALTNLGGYVLGRSVGLNRLLSYALGFSVATLPLYFFLYNVDWWNASLGSVAFVWSVACLLRLYSKLSALNLLMLAVTVAFMFTVGWPLTFVAFAVVATTLAAYKLWSHRGEHSLWLKLRWPVVVAAVTGLSALAAFPALSEYIYLSRSGVLDRVNSLSNFNNFWVPSANQVLNIWSPVQGDFWSSFGGYVWWALPMGFVTVLAVALPFVSNYKDILKNRVLLACLTVAVLLMFMTQMPSQVGPIRWPARYIVFAQVFVAVVIFKVLSMASFKVNRVRVSITFALVGLCTLAGASRIPSIDKALMHSMVLPIVYLGVCCMLILLLKRNGLSRSFVVFGVLAGFILASIQTGSMGGSVLTGVLPDKQSLSSLKAKTSNGFLFDARGAAPGENQIASEAYSARYLLGGVPVFSGYDPVGHTGFIRTFTPAASQGMLEGDTLLPWLVADSHGCKVDQLRIQSVIVDNNASMDLLDGLKRCGFVKSQTVGGTHLWITDRWKTPLSSSTLAQAGARVVTSVLPGMTNMHEMLRVDNKSSSPEAVTFARMYYPGYTATLDGKPLKVSAKQGLSVEVTVPAGASGTLDLRYWPVTWHWAWPLAGLSAVGCGLLIVFFRRRELAASKSDKV